MSARLLFVCAALLVLVDVARGEGTYQSTRNGRALVWNNHPKRDDEASWSGGRDREGYARGFGTLIWYTEETKFGKAALYARYWGRMVDGKFEGPVNVHAKRTTRYAIFIDGMRVTGWTAGAAPLRATTRWRTLVAKHRAISEPSFAERSGVVEPEAPAEGPGRTGGPSSSWNESIQDLRSERWPMIDIDDSLRLLAWPPRSLRTRPEH